MKIDCAFDEMIPLEKLVSNPRNNNTHSDKQIKILSKLISAHGFRYPIVVSKRSGFIVSGHGRLAALKLLGVKEAPVDFQDFSSEAEEYQVLTSDNEIARWSVLDYDLVRLALNDMPDIELDLLGIKNFKLDEVELKSDDGIIEDKKFMLVLELKDENELMMFFNEMQSREIKCTIME